MTDQELMYASDEDVAFFHKCTNGLPGVHGFSGTGFDAKGERIPYGLGPHSVRCLREITDIVKPNHILEIGFNMGGSASMWLNLSDASYTGIDISDKAETLKAAEILKERYGDRFKFILSDSAAKNLTWDLRDKKYNLCFVDGGHLEHHVVADIGLCLSLGIKYIAFDDVLVQFGPGVLPAIAHFPQLKLIKELGNISLYENTSI